MNWFKCINPRSEVMIEITEQLGEKGAWQVVLVLAEAYAQKVDSLDIDRVSNWAYVKKDRAARLLPFAKKALEELRKISRKSTKNVSEMCQESTENLVDSTPSKPDGSTRVKNRTEHNKTEHTESEAFLKFWSAYPNKKAKAKTWIVWHRDNLDSIADQIITSVEQYKLTKGWQKDNGEFIPLPTTYLNGKRWKDEIETNVTPIKPSGPTWAEQLILNTHIQDKYTGEVIDIRGYEADGDWLKLGTHHLPARDFIPPIEVADAG